MGVSRQNGTHLFIFAYGRARALPGTAHLRKVEFENHDFISGYCPS